MRRKGEADIVAARRLLSRLRDVMAGEGDNQDRLNKAANLIAASLKSEVCSIYVMRAGEILELFATQGLKQSAVHLTRMRVGEGLVGAVATGGRSIVLADAWSHPAFAYRPETGEDLFHSFVGVPIIRGLRVIGVLVVQNRETRPYSEVEVETLETVTMVLAELLATSQVVSREELLPTSDAEEAPRRLEGMSLVPGVGIGLAVMHEPRFRAKRLVAEDPESELKRLRDALQALRSELDAMLAVDEGVMSGIEFREILQAYRMFADDAGWVNRISVAVGSGLTAEAAVQKVQSDTRMRMAQVSDSYLRERLHDLDDLTNRLLGHLVGEEGRIALQDFPDDAVLVCRNLGPTELLDYDRAKLRGLVMEEGSRTMHAVIVARALGVPVVARVKDVFSHIEPMDALIVDGDQGQVVIRSSEDVREHYEKSLRALRRKKREYGRLKNVPAESLDGVRVSLMLNVGLLIDLPHLDDSGADGIGLYRTELPFMARPTLPDVSTQTELYASVLDQVKGRPVVFRTLDVGSDKILPYWQESPEDNPALGWRSLRITLDRPAILRQQLRSLIRAASGQELRVMFPMVAEVNELRKARKILNMELARARASSFGSLPTRVEVGAMLEIPALLWQLPALLREVDFISIGSNDLVQFLFASDRGNWRIADRYDCLSPSVLKVLFTLSQHCAEAGVSVSVCGEMAGRPLDALALTALGFRTLSMSAVGVGPVKAAIRSANIGEMRQYLLSQLDSPDRSLREKLRLFANDHHVVTT